MDIKDKIIEDLKKRLEEEIAVKKSETMINAELKVLIDKLEMQVQLLNEINERAYKDIAELRFRAKQLSIIVNET
jgi:hypothetical protein